MACYLGIAPKLQGFGDLTTTVILIAYKFGATCWYRANLSRFSGVHTSVYIKVAVLKHSFDLHYHVFLKWHPVRDSNSRPTGS